MSDHKTTTTTGNNAVPSIHVSKAEVMVDEKVQITVEGLHGNQKITLLATMELRKRKFASCGHYTADDDGQVFTFVDHSHGGSFTGVQPMGLFTSMRDPVNGRRLIELDVTTPYNVTLSIHNGHLDFENLARGFFESRVSPLTVASLKRWHMRPGVKRTLVHEGRMYGALFLPPGDGPFPGIVDVFGMPKGIVDYRASLLASHGFAVLALAYMDYKDLPKLFKHQNISYFVDAVDWLYDHPMVRRGGVGMIGQSAGGNLCLMTAAMSAKVKVVVSINGHVFPVLPGPHKFGDVTVESFKFDPSKLIMLDGGAIAKDVYRDYKIKDHLIPIWQRDVRTLIIAGEDDLCNDPQWTRDLEAAIPPEKKRNFRFLYYPGTGHVIDPPYSPLCRASYMGFEDLIYLWGGDPEYHLPAQEHSWRQILSFLTENLLTKSHL